MSDSGLYDENYYIDRLVEGDVISFETIYRRYQGKAFAIALTYLSSPSLAEDAVQELFLKLWHKRQQLAGVEQFEQYLFIMLRNLLVSELRKKEKQEKIQGYLQQVPVLQPTPADVSEISDMQKLIGEALVQLPDKQQQVYRMSREQGLTHEEIANHLALSPRTVSNIITLVLNHLRLALQAQGFLPELLALAGIFFL